MNQNSGRKTSMFLTRVCLEFECSQASKMELFTKIFHSLQPSAVQLSIASYLPNKKLHLNAWLGSVLYMPVKVALSDIMKPSFTLAFTKDTSFKYSQLASISCKKQCKTRSNELNWLRTLILNLNIIFKTNKVFSLNTNYLAQYQSVSYSYFIFVSWFSFSKS